jgi:hypothetical protein
LSIGPSLAAQDAQVEPLPLPPVAAQFRLQPPLTSSSQPQALPEKPVAKSSQGQKSSRSNDRLFWVLPNFFTVENSTATDTGPMTPGQKFETTARGLYDPFEFGLMGFVAAIGQASNADPTYGQGIKGYGLRYATDYGDNFIENFMASAVFPSVLHQDPRYYELGHGGFWRRSAHAVSRLIITKSDSGQTEPNYSELGGALTAAAISTYTYHPQSERGFADVASTWGTQMGWDAFSYMLKEFWPDLRKRSTRHKNNLTSTDQQSSSDQTSK